MISQLSKSLLRNSEAYLFILKELAEDDGLLRESAETDGSSTIIRSSSSLKFSISIREAGDTDLMGELLGLKYAT